MMRQRKSFTPEKKVSILREYLLDNVPVSDLCDKYGLNPNVFYRWQKEMFENAPAIFQHKKLLQKYFEEFRKNVEDDPSGYETLKKVLGIRTEKDMQKFQTRWEKWVLSLKFP